MKILLIVCGLTGSGKEKFSWRYPVQFMCDNHSEVKLQEDSFAVETTLGADSTEVNLLATKGIANGFTVQVAQCKFEPRSPSSVKNTTIVLDTTCQFSEILEYCF